MKNDMAAQAQTRYIHRWTPEEKKQLLEIVENLQPTFAQAKADGRPETAVWSLVPGKLGILVSPHACQSMHENILRMAKAASPTPTATNGSSPASEILEELRSLVRLSGAVLSELTKTNEALYTLRGQMKDAIEASTASTEMWLEKISNQFDRLLNELKHG